MNPIIYRDNNSLIKSIGFYIKPIKVDTPKMPSTKYI